MTEYIHKYIESFLFEILGLFIPPPLHTHMYTHFILRIARGNRHQFAKLELDLAMGKKDIIRTLTYLEVFRAVKEDLDFVHSVTNECY